MAASKSIYDDDDVIKFTELQKNVDLNLYYKNMKQKYMIVVYYHQNHNLIKYI